MVVWVGAGEMASSIGCGEAPFHRGPPSEAGEGMCPRVGWVGMTVVAVEVEEVEDAADDATRAGAGESGVADAINRGLVSCCGCAPVEVSLGGEDDDGGEGKREAPPVAEGCGALAEDSVSVVSHSLRRA